jgi:surface polysaccharide O-acyltransferase-like enzyme
MNNESTAREFSGVEPGNNSSRSRRDHNLDMIKVISIFLVVLIHYCNYYTKRAIPDASVNYLVALLYNVLARVSVPLFFMASGALAFRKDFDYKKNNRKINRMIMVLIVWNVLYWLWNRFYLGRSLGPNVTTYLFEPVKGHLWYMYAYIGLLIAGPLIALLAKHMTPRDENYFLLTWIFICGGIRTLDCNFDYFGIKTGLEYCVPIIQGTYYLGYYLTGHILYRRLRDHQDAGAPWAEKSLRRPIPAYLLTAAASLLLCFLCVAFTSIRVGETAKDLFGYSNILVMIPSLCLFVVLMRVRIRENALLTLISRHSFGIYLSHVIFYNIAYRNFDIRAMDSPLLLPLFTIATFVVTLAFVIITSKIPRLKTLLYG